MSPRSVLSLGLFLLAVVCTRQVCARGTSGRSYWMFGGAPGSLSLGYVREPDGSLKQIFFLNVLEVTLGTGTYSSSRSRLGWQTSFGFAELQIGAVYDHAFASFDEDGWFGRIGGSAVARLVYRSDDGWANRGHSGEGEAPALGPLLELGTGYHWLDRTGQTDHDSSIVFGIRVAPLLIRDPVVEKWIPGAQVGLVLGVRFERNVVCPRGAGLDLSNWDGCG